MLSPEVDALRVASGIERSLSTITIGAWFVADDQLTKLVQLAKAERDAELRKQEPVGEVTHCFYFGGQNSFENCTGCKAEGLKPLLLGTKLYAEPVPPRSADGRLKKENENG